MLRRTVKTIVSVSMAILMVTFVTPFVFADSWSNHTDSGFSGGSGTVSDPYQIANAQQLALLSKKVNEANRTAPVTDNFILTQDIHLTGNDWEPIGTLQGQYSYFNGVFDGNGKKIDGLTIGTQTKPSNTYGEVGLFGDVGEKAIIKNINLSVTIYSSQDSSFIGGLAGRNRGYIINCHVDGIVSDPSIYVDVFDVGGLVGINNGSIDTSDSSATVSGGNSDFLSIGGLAGTSSPYYNGSSHPPIITNCRASGNVTGGKGATVGGLLGDDINSNIADCYSTGSATGNQGIVGGLIGYIGTIAASNLVDINRCHATGNVIDANMQSGSNIIFAGGFVGEATYCTITNSFATGNVSVNTDPAHSPANSSAGGFAARTDAHIYNSYATGNVTGGKNVDLAGFITDVDNAYYKGNFIIKNCFAYGDVLSYGDTTSSEQVAGFSVTDTWNSIENCYWNQSAQQTYKSQPVLNKVGGPSTSHIAAKTDSEIKSTAFLELLNSSRAGQTDWLPWNLGSDHNNLPYLQLVNPVPNPAPASSQTPAPSKNSSTVSTSVPTASPTTNSIPQSTVSNPQTGNTNQVITLEIGIAVFLSLAVSFVLLKNKKYNQAFIKK